MVKVTIPNLPEETHRALRLRAKTNGRSLEAEIHAIVEYAVNADGGLKLGSALVAIGGVDLDIRRDQTPTAFALFD